MRKIIILFLLLASCISPYDFTQEETNVFLVVEGYVSDNTGDSGIKLSWSGDFEQKTYDEIPNAQVIVIENEVDEYPYSYYKNGVYKPVQEDFLARKNNTYSLRITLNGQVYESDLVILPNSLDMDNLTYKSASVSYPGDMTAHPRLNLHLTSNIDENASMYYIYSAEETWMVVAPYSHDFKIRPIFFYEGNFVPLNIDFEVDTMVNITNCWPNNKSAGIIIATTEGLSRNQLIDVPVFSVNLESEKLLYRYSVLINQYAISQEAHHFFDLLAEFTENQGYLYDIQPGYVTGNIRNLNNPDDPVIGMFYAANHSSYRIFLSMADLTSKEKQAVIRYQLKCQYKEYEIPALPPDSIPNAKLTRRLTYLRDSLLYKQGLVIRDYYSMFNEEGDSILLLELSNLNCADCRVSGTNIVPDWWGGIY